MWGKWALRSITTNKASGGDGIPVELFQILKDDAGKCCPQYANKFGKLSSGHRTGKGVFIPVPKKDSAKECSYYCTIALISHTSKVMLKIFQARLQQYIDSELQMFKLHLERQWNQRSNCQHLLDHRKSKRVPEKHLLLLHWLCQSLWLCGLHQTMENSSRDGNTRPPDLPSEKPVCRSGNNS